MTPVAYHLTQMLRNMILLHIDKERSYDCNVLLLQLVQQHQTKTKSKAPDNNINQ